MREADMKALATINTDLAAGGASLSVAELCRPASRSDPDENDDDLMPLRHAIDESVHAAVARMTGACRRRRWPRPGSTGPSMRPSRRASRRPSV